MNLHRLELFYYVAEYQGITRAALHIGYGIQQPAISEQVGNLEAELGGRLFERQPFRLTLLGKELFDGIAPFFRELKSLEARLREGNHPRLRIAAAETILEHHLPPVLGRIEQLHPGIHFGLRSASGTQMCEWLRTGEVDLVITALADRPASGLASRPLLSLPLVLLVARTSAIGSAEHFWAQRSIAEPLICPPREEGVGRVFERGLRQGRLHWPTSLETSCVATVTRYVAEGRGVGVSLDFPSLVRHPDVRTLEVKGFDPVQVMLLWRPADSTRLRTLVGIMEARARLLCAGDFAPAAEACASPC